MATYAARINAARDIRSTFASQVIFSLIDHAKWQLNPENSAHPGVSAEKQALAQSVLNNPDAYAWRFGSYIITSPAYASLDLTDIPDETVLASVVDTFPVFAPELPE